MKGLYFVSSTSQGRVTCLSWFHLGGGRYSLIQHIWFPDTSQTDSFTVETLTPWPWQMHVSDITRQCLASSHHQSNTPHWASWKNHVNVPMAVLQANYYYLDRLLATHGSQLKWERRREMVEYDTAKCCGCCKAGASTWSANRPNQGETQQPIISHQPFAVENICTIRMRASTPGTDHLMYPCATSRHRKYGLYYKAAVITTPFRCDIYIQNGFKGLRKVIHASNTLMK